MRSSKSRSRSKSNRSRTVGNIVNRVFDSSGPEGKVRGTPQQIIDKYAQLARDATLGNDRVAAENFQQHAEHYTRMLGEAQREQDARREQQEQANRDRQRDRQDNTSNPNNTGGGGGENAGNNAASAPRRDTPQPDALQAMDQPETNGPDVIEDESQGAPQPDLVMDLPGAGASTGSPDAAGIAPAGDSAAGNGLVETPEGKPQPRSKPRAPRPRRRKPEAPESSAGSSDDAAPEGSASDAAK